MNLLLFGPPGAGKGTQSALLVEKKNMVHISTGNIFRLNIKNQTKLGLEAKKYMDQGDLVPDSVTIGMVGDVLKELGRKDFILDGFPRTVPQAESLDQLLKKYNMQIDRVVFFNVPNEMLVERLAGRRVCQQCGAVYHISGNPPARPDLCDKCGGKVVQRADDQEEAIRTRLKVYEETTQPVKEFYRKQSLLAEIDGTGSTEEVYERLEDVLNN